MKFLLDENLPRSLAQEVKNLNHEVITVFYAGLQGSDDRIIAKYALQQKAILVTKDLEFGSRLYYPKGSHYGLFIIKLPHNSTKEMIINDIIILLTDIDVSLFSGNMIILERNKYRIRKFE
jgi:predicted nuclease of predicted toxin-antitoxin system